MIWISDLIKKTVYWNQIGSNVIEPQLYLKHTAWYFQATYCAVFIIFASLCSPSNNRETVKQHLRENRLTQRCLRFNYTMHFQTSVGFHNKLFKKKAINFELNIHFHNYLKKKQFQQWRKEAVKHVKQRRFTFYFTAYFVFGGLHVRFESQPEVVRGLHQVLRGTDQNLVNWTRHRPRCLHQRASLSGKERGESGWQMSDGADCFF